MKLQETKIKLEGEKKFRDTLQTNTNHQACQQLLNGDSKLLIQKTLYEQQLNLVESTLGSISDILINIQSSLIQAGNGIHNVQDHKIMSHSIDSQLKTIKDTLSENKDDFDQLLKLIDFQWPEYDDYLTAMSNITFDITSYSAEPRTTAIAQGLEQTKDYLEQTIQARCQSGNLLNQPFVPDPLFNDWAKQQIHLPRWSDIDSFQINQQHNKNKRFSL